MNNIFYNDNTLAQFEQHEQWEESVKYLAELVHRDSENPHILYRLAAQCWYVLTSWDCEMPKERLDRTVFESNLEKAYILAKKRWWNDSDCLWLFGYFMIINQFDFPYVSADILEVEKEGRGLIRQAFSLDPNNELARIWYLADTVSNRKWFRARKELKKSIYLFFPSHSKVDKYFAEVFTSVN